MSNSADTRQGTPLTQCAAAVLMVRPMAFAGNPETAASNAFQSAAQISAKEQAAARMEFDSLAAALERAGVEVLCVNDTPDPPKPDACFPNNWLSLHHDGTAVLYPMLSPVRRRERRPELLTEIQAQGFEILRVLDLADWEDRGAHLEGTGSMVLDHRSRVAYACPSPRTHREVLLAFAGELGYAPVSFEATGPAGEPLYHTNVLMCIGEGFATVCAEAIVDPGQRAQLVEALAATGRELLLISRAQMSAFAGNMLALATRSGSRVIALSATAWAALDAGQRRALERHGEIVAAAVPTVERYGGGSVRCMLAEVFLPRSAAA